VTATAIPVNLDNTIRRLLRNHTEKTVPRKAGVDLTNRFSWREVVIVTAAALVMGFLVSSSGQARVGPLRLEYLTRHVARAVPYFPLYSHALVKPAWSFGRTSATGGRESPSYG
jgi:hypothetical protein